LIDLITWSNWNWVTRYQFHLGKPEDLYWYRFQDQY